MEGVTTTVVHGDARSVLLRMREEGVRLHACITDPPYELGLHALAWDRSGIAHDPEFWGLVRDVLLPGAFVVALSSLRRYHHLATATEQAGLVVQAPMIWLAGGGLPAGANIAELIDRRLAPRRRPIGEEKASGRALANATLGAQVRNTTSFEMRRRGVSPEARMWRGHHHGPGVLKPDAEIILVAQVPIEAPTMLEHLAKHATGTVNVGRYRKAHGEWPSAVLQVPRARGAERYGHATAKPQRLMENLCMLFAPPGGMILDPFGGSGTTGAAAQALRFSSALIEQDPEIAAVAARRLGVPMTASHVPPFRASDSLAHVTSVSDVANLSEAAGKAVAAEHATAARKRAAPSRNREKVAAYRDRLPMRRLRQVQHWCWDLTMPSITDEVVRQARVLAAKSVAGRGAGD